MSWSVTKTRRHVHKNASTSRMIAHTSVVEAISLFEALGELHRHVFIVLMQVQRAYVLFCNQLYGVFSLAVKSFVHDPRKSRKERRNLDISCR